jgi:hypothetical protein
MPRALTFRSGKLHLKRMNKLRSAIIGYSGFVGTTLTRQAAFDGLYRSTNIQEIRGQQYDIVVCAGAPAQKWIANIDPRADRNGIEGLIDHLRTVTCKTFVLISTVDVFKAPVAVDEATRVDEAGLHAYGLHRYFLEKFVEAQYPGHLIVRLPGLVGPGLRKNAIFDFLNNNKVDSIDSRSVFQFYPMVNLWWDIQTALQAQLRLVHLTAAPLSMSDVYLEGFGQPFTQELSSPPSRYDMQTRHATVFGANGRYQYSARESLQAIRAYAQSERATLGGTQGTRS